MDDAGLDHESHLRALAALARINAISCSARRIWSELECLADAGGEPLRLLDVACGGGDVLRRLARRAHREGLAMELEGCDASRAAVQHAAFQGQTDGLEARFFQRDVLTTGLPGGYDVVLSTLFLHHVDETEAVELLEAMARAARRLLVVQDLRRTRTGYVLAWAGTRLLTRSRVARTDGPRSVQAAFTLEEVRGLARRAGLEGATVSSCWPQRFQLAWRPPG